MIRYFHLLQDTELLPKESRDHELKGNYKGFREFHLGGDMLVIYYKEENQITLARIGTHSQLFN